MILAELSLMSALALQFCDCGMCFGNGICCILKIPSHFICQKEGGEFFGSFYDYGKADEKCKDY